MGEAVENKGECLPTLDEQERALRGGRMQAKT